MQHDITADPARNAPATQRNRKTGTINPYVLLFIMLVITAAATWIVPPGEFGHVLREGVKFAVPGSLHPVARSGVGPETLFTFIAEGMVKSAPIIFLILFTGGAVNVLEQSGALSNALNAMARRKGSSDTVIILSVCAVFSVLGTTGVVINSVVAFIPLGMLLARSMNLPRIFGGGLIYLGTYAGFNDAIINPGTTGLAQRLAELPLFSGMGFRLGIYLAFAVCAIVFLTLYARRCRREGLANEDENAQQHIAANVTPFHWLILAFTALALLTFIYGAVNYGWSENEMSAMFIVVALGVGLIARLRGGSIADTFLQGCAQLIPGALIVGLARAIAPLNEMFAALGMFISAAVMHIAISSGSGESAALVPLYVPLGDALHITRQVTVETILLGEGVINSVNPTSSVMMAVLAIGRIGYGQWLRFVFPLTLMWLVIAIIAIIIGVQIQWGPF
ncbi:C4-dicarboxylate anaerobic carrier [Candidatus Sodalis pierantonius str. SOPE]|uniref:C4-dicarboxylate anaerobic carrier n=1 Tax=Candidatus Sodalis pierantonii str. SOPE TaxID=2342 RepID=W0HPX3_9GAMM|nr:YfcC family protein [Candidatus Sodalis pierantonius]AHF74532.1 C4-dicarboxylate anaerobic carrier [Candidatus Sodalis pierantonius str. SOPE]